MTLSIYALEQRARELDAEAAKCRQFAKSIKGMPDPVGPYITELASILARHDLVVIHRETARTAMKAMEQYEPQEDDEDDPRASQRGVVIAMEKMAASMTLPPIDSPVWKKEPAPQMTDEQIDQIAESMPSGLDGFLKGWGWRQFARQILLGVPSQDPVPETRK